MAHDLAFPLQIENAGDKYALAIEKFTGMVKNAYYNAATFEPLMTVQMLEGTNKLSADGLGKVTVGALTPGDSLPVSKPGRDRASVTVDTVIATRYEQFILDKKQDDINILSRVPVKQGQAMARFADQVYCNMLIKAALTADGLVNDMPGGTTIEFSAAGDELDPDKLLAGIEAAVIAMEQNEVPLSDMRLVLDIPQYYTLLKNDKLTNSEYSLGNGDFAKGRVLKAFDLPIFRTVVFPKVVDAAALLGTAYNVTAEMTDCCGLIFTPDTLLSARAIDMTTETEREFDTKVFQVDSYFAMGTTVYNPAEAAGIFKYRA